MNLWHDAVKTQTTKQPEHHQHICNSFDGRLLTNCSIYLLPGDLLIFFSCIKLKPRINKANPFTEIPRNWKTYLLEPSTSSRLLSTFVGWIGIEIGQKIVKIHTQQKLFTIYYYELTERERKKIDILFVIWCCSVSHTHSSVICWANWICRLRQSAKSQQNRNRRKNTQPEKRIGIARGATKTIH